MRVARIFNTFGPRMHMNDGRVVSNFILQALQGEPLTVGVCSSDECVLGQGSRSCCGRLGFLYVPAPLVARRGGACIGSGRGMTSVTWVTLLSKPAENMEHGPWAWSTLPRPLPGCLLVPLAIARVVSVLRGRSGGREMDICVVGLGTFL